MFVLGSVSLLFPHWKGLLAYSIKYVSVSVSLSQRGASQIIDKTVHAVSYSASVPTDSPPFNVSPEQN